MFQSETSHQRHRGIARPEVADRQPHATALERFQQQQRHAQGFAAQRIFSGHAIYGGDIVVGISAENSDVDIEGVSDIAGEVRALHLADQIGCNSISLLEKNYESGYADQSS